jgi:hypothetical protein
VDEGRIDCLREALAREYPAARLFAVSARTGQGLDDWFAAITGHELVADADLDIDYSTYGEGEALLGWLNATLRIDGPAFDGNAWVADLARRIHAGLESDGIEIAHLKMTLSPSDEGGDLAVLNQVRNEQQAELSHRLMDEVTRGQLIVNLRAEGDPARLHALAMGAVAEAAAGSGLASRVEHVEHFRPGQPNPTYRLVPA